MGQADARHLLVETYKDSDYEEYKGLWEKQNANCPDKDVLSKYGIKITLDGNMVCCGFLFDTGCSMCMFEWYIVNKDAPRNVRKDALNLLVEKVKEYAKLAGYRFIYTGVGSESFMKKLTDHGFTVNTPKKMVHMFYKV